MSINRTRPRLAATLSPEADRVLRTMAESDGLTRSRFLDRLVLEEWRRRQAFAFDFIRDAALDHPERSPVELARAHNIELRVVNQVLAELDLNSVEKRMAAAQERVTWDEQLALLLQEKRRRAAGRRRRGAQ